MGLRDPMPPDPFQVNTPDLNQWAANCRAMYTSLLACDFTNVEALEITIRCMQAMLAKAAV